MVAKIASVATILALAAGAQGSYKLLTADAGGGLAGTDGGAFTTSDGSAFYNEAVLGGNTPPNPALFGSFPALEWDSYFALDGGGPSVTGYYANNPGTGNGLTTSPGSEIAGSVARSGYFVAGPPRQPGTAPDGFAGIFVARLTVNDGVLVQNDGFLVETLGSGTLAAMVLDGPGVEVDEDGNPLPKLAGLRSYLVAEPNINGQDYDVYDIWFQNVIPAPGALALAGLAGVAGLRRRR